MFSGAIPVALSNLLTYYVVNPLADTFQVEATIGGGAIVFAADAAGAYNAFTTTNTNATISGIRADSGAIVVRQLNRATFDSLKTVSGAFIFTGLSQDIKITKSEIRCPDAGCVAIYPTGDVQNVSFGGSNLCSGFSISDTDNFITTATANHGVRIDGRATLFTACGFYGANKTTAGAYQVQGLQYASLSNCIIYTFDGANKAAILDAAESAITSCLYIAGKTLTAETTANNTQVA